MSQQVDQKPNPHVYVVCSTMPRDSYNYHKNAHADKLHAIFYCPEKAHEHCKEIEAQYGGHPLEKYFSVEEIEIK